MQQSQAIGFSVGDIKKMSGSLLPVGILALVGMLVLPLPVVLLDMFFVFNITISLLILMVALHTHRPLDFSSFPNLLLLATVLRLGLNVASTRVVYRRVIMGPMQREKLSKLLANSLWRAIMPLVCLYLLFW